MSTAWLLNTAWMLSCAREAARFHRATRQVAETQSELLADILRANRDTQFGRGLDFGRIRNPRDYQRAVPPSRYEDYEDPIKRIADGAPNVLTREPVTLLEPTSGTTGGEKLIPYTASLRRQFQRAVAAWVADLFGASGRAPRPRLLVAVAGPGTAAAHGRRHSYRLRGRRRLSRRVEQVAVRRLLVAPPSLARLTDLDAFRYGTLYSLLCADDLALISVWSPTFLTALFNHFEEWQDRLCADIARGSPQREKPDPRRAAALNLILRSCLSLSEKLRLVWPRLALISCWADGSPAGFLPELRALLPAVEVQPKGLLATEGVVSLPLVGCEGAALAIRSHFFEFEEAETPDGRFRLAHELDRGGRYRVVLTTGGGLYRYALRDEVKVAGFIRQCPLLRFLGKCDRVSDLIGEKLAEAHVRAVLDRLFAAAGLQPRFALLAPAPGRPPRYRLYLQGLAGRRGARADRRPATGSGREPLLPARRRLRPAGPGRGPSARPRRAAGLDHLRAAMSGRRTAVRRRQAGRAGRLDRMAGPLRGRLQIRRQPLFQLADTVNANADAA